jgi:hypothetical protein
MASTSWTSLHTLLSIEQALVQLMRGHRRSGSALIDHLHQAVIFFIEAVDDVGGEFGITKGLANGGQRVREFPNLVVVVRDAQVQLLALAKLTTESIGARLGLS